MEKDLPKPRTDLEFVPVRDKGRDLIVIRDRFELVPEGLAIAPGLYRFLYHLEKVHDMQELRQQLAGQAGGRLIAREEVNQVLADLERSYLLDTANFRSAREAFKAEFAAQTVRPATLAGVSYPAEAAVLGEQLDGLLAGAQGRKAAGGPVTGLVAPHIDLSVGGKGYAEAYACFPKQGVERVIVLGIGHHMEQGLFALTEKDFATVFGLLPADRAAVAGLRHSGGALLADSDFDHRSEHSIEFQTLFLRHLQGDRNLQLIPILCGSPWAFLPDFSRQAFLDAAGPLLENLRSLSARDGTLVLAGVDFSHIGPKFGHEETATRMESEARQHDSGLLAALCRRDPEAFWRISREVRDRYHVCGFSALATLLEILPPSRGELLHYELWHEQATRSAVSFAAAVFSQA